MTKELVRLFRGLALLGVIAVAGSCALDQGPMGVATANTTVAPNALLGTLLGPTGLLQCPSGSRTRTTT